VHLAFLELVGFPVWEQGFSAPSENGHYCSSEEGVEKPFGRRYGNRTTNLPGNCFALAWAKQQRG
jgi:hypothetical protein